MAVSLLPLFLGIRLGPDVGKSPQGRSPDKSDVEKTLRRDAFACRCCGFVSKKFQRVIPLSDLDAKASERDYVTVCSFCEMVTGLDRAGLNGTGHLIWLPEIPQNDLHHVMRALYVAQASNVEPMAKAGKRTLEVLTSRRAEAKKRLGTDDPLLLATVMRERMDQAMYKARHEKLEGIRFLPSDKYVVQQQGADLNIFPAMIDYWTSSAGPFGQLPVSGWTDLFNEVSAKASGS